MNPTLTQQLTRTKKALDEVLEILQDPCPLCERMIDLTDESNYHEFEDGVKWCKDCYTQELNENE